MEFSKLILLVLWITTTIVIFFAFVLMWKYGDLTPLTIIIGGLFAEITAATGFYYWKAKNENMAKYKKLNIQEDINDEFN